MDQTEVCPESLWIVTGTLDDPRPPIQPGHPRFGQFLQAFRRQDDWPAEFHAMFWEANLAHWPHPRHRRPTREHLATLVEYMRSQLFTPAEIAGVIHVDPDTIRRRRLAQIGERLADEDPRDLTLGSDKWDAIEGEHGPPPPLPRVYDHDPELDSIYGLPAVEDPTLKPVPAFVARAGASARDGGGIDQLRLAHLRDGTVRRVGSMLVRFTDGEPDVVGAFKELRRLLRLGDQGGDVDLIIRDGQERGSLPPENRDGLMEFMRRP